MIKRLISNRISNLICLNSKAFGFICLRERKREREHVDGNKTDDDAHKSSKTGRRIRPCKRGEAIRRLQTWGQRPSRLRPHHNPSLLRAPTRDPYRPQEIEPTRPKYHPHLDLSVPRSKAVDQISRASRELGFFQIVNHGIPLGVLERTIGSIKAFHEQPTEIKARFYRREGLASGVSFICNFDLFQSKAASWRDTLQVRLGPTLADLEEIPEICRNEVVEWDSRIKPLGDLLMGLLCEGLGLNTGRLKDMTCLEGRLMVGHYYPYCPQPDLTIGATCHTDPGVFTILLQDHIGGLQVKYGEEWVDVKPVPGAIVINIADVLQIMSNDEYKSVEHRVLANPSQEPRISIVVFLNPTEREKIRAIARAHIPRETSYLPAVPLHRLYDKVFRKRAGRQIFDKLL